MLNPTQQNVDGKKHCILIAASNPYPLPTRVYSLQGQSDGVETQAGIQLCDAESVAKSFAQVRRIVFILFLCFFKRY